MTVLRPYNNFDYTSYSDPASDTNPPSVGMTWANLTSGEIFICKDNTVNTNIWQGSQGTYVSIWSNKVVFKQGQFGGKNIIDISGNYNDLFVSGDIRSYSRDNKSYALYYGANDCASSALTSVYGYALWVKLPALATNHHYCCGVRASSSDANRFYSAWLSGTTGGIENRIIDSSNTAVDCNMTISGNTWVHIAFIISSTTKVSAYINGVLENTATTTNTFSPRSNNFYIGDQEDGGNDPEHYMGDLVIFNGYLTDDEIMQVYLESNP